MNIVFDLGGVVFDWQPDKIINGVFADTAKHELVRKEVFGHPDWIELDRGTLALDDAVSRAVSRTGLAHDDINRLYGAVPGSLTLKPETLELVRSVAETDHKLFVLSNMQHTSIQHLEREHDFWKLFDGIVVSCRIQMVKPEIAIYEHLLVQNRILATETVFIDDMPENLTAAATLGIGTIRFSNAAQCRQDLEKLLSG